MDLIGGGFVQDYKKNESFDQIIRDNILSQVKKKNLTEKHIDFFEKMSIFTSEYHELIDFGSGMAYLHESIIYLVETNKTNANRNPFFPLLLTYEKTLFNNFILLFANLFTLITPKEDSFSIYNLLKTISIKEKGIINIDENFRTIIKNNFETREFLKKSYSFFENKDNKTKIGAYVKVRNEIIAHPTRNSNYGDIEHNLNHFLEFIIDFSEGLHKIFGISHHFDGREQKKEVTARWGFYYENIKKHGLTILSDEFTEAIEKAFNTMKFNTYNK